MNGNVPPVLAVLTCCCLLEAGAEPPATGPAPGPPSKITGALLAKLPKYAPPAPVRAVEAAPSRDADGSSGEILQLPKMTVRPAPVAPESAFALLNAKGRLELALETHPGIRLGNILGLNEGMARGMQQEERLAAKKADLADQVQRSAIGDSEADKKIRRLMKALLRRSATDAAWP